MPTRGGNMLDQFSFLKPQYGKFSEEERARLIPSHEEFQIGFQVLGKEHFARIWIPKALQDDVDMHSILHATRLKLQTDGAPNDIDVPIKTAKMVTVVTFDLPNVFGDLSNLLFKEDPWSQSNILQKNEYIPPAGEFLNRKFFLNRFPEEPGSRYRLPDINLFNPMVNEKPFVGHAANWLADRDYHDRNPGLPVVLFLVETYKAFGLDKILDNRYYRAGVIALHLYQGYNPSQVEQISPAQIETMVRVVKFFRANPTEDCCESPVCSARYALKVLREFVKGDDVPPEEAPLDPRDSGPEPVRLDEPELETA